MDRGPTERVLALRGGRQTVPMLASLATGWLLVLGVRFVVPALLPTIRAEFGVSNTAAGLAVTVLWLSYAVMQFPTGVLVHRVGERALLVAAAGLSAFALAAYLVTPVFGVFLVATAALGVGTGLYGPSRGTLLSRTYDDREGTAFGVVMAAGSLGAAALPALAASATARWGWRVALATPAPALALVAVALWMTVPDREREAGIALRDSLRPAARALRRRRVALAVLGATAMLFAFQAVTAFLTTFLVDVHGVSQPVAGTVLAGLFVGGALSQTVTGGLADRYDTPRVLAAVAGASVVPLLALPHLTGRLALGLAALAIGLRMSSGPLVNAYVIDYLPDDVEGTAWGALRTGFFAVGSLGSTVIGVFADADRYALAFYLLAAVTAVAALAYWRLPARE